MCAALCLHDTGVLFSAVSHSKLVLHSRVQHSRYCSCHRVCYVAASAWLKGVVRRVFALMERWTKTTKVTKYKSRARVTISSTCASPQIPLRAFSSHIQLEILLAFVAIGATSFDMVDWHHSGVGLSSVLRIAYLRYPQRNTYSLRYAQPRRTHWVIGYDSVHAPGTLRRRRPHECARGAVGSYWSGAMSDFGLLGLRLGETTYGGDTVC